MNIDVIISILKAHEQVVHRPKNQAKNSLTHGVIRDNYKKVANEIKEMIDKKSSV